MSHRCLPCLSAGVGSKNHSSWALVGLKPAASTLHFPPPHRPKSPLSSHAAPERQSDDNRQRGRPRARPSAERKQIPGLAGKVTESREVERNSALVSGVRVFHSPLGFRHTSPWDGRGVPGPPGVQSFVASVITQNRSLRGDSGHRPGLLTPLICQHHN